VPRLELFIKAFEGKYSYLLKEIDVDHGLLPQLRTLNVLTPEQIEDCKSRVRYYSLLRKTILLGDNQQTNS